MYSVGDYSMRPIGEKDLHQILEWRNSDEIHSLMLTDHKITWKEHYSWFKRIENNFPKRHFVFEYQGRPVGYIAYNDFDEQTKTCSPGIYLGDKNSSPPEAGIYLTFMSGKYAFEELGMTKLKGDVFAKNKKSLAINKHLGAQIVGSENVQKDGVQELVYQLETTKENWQKNREVLRICFPDF